MKQTDFTARKFIVLTVIMATGALIIFDANKTKDEPPEISDMRKEISCAYRTDCTVHVFQIDTGRHAYCAFWDNGYECDVDKGEMR